MKDYRALFGYAAIVLALGFFVRSFAPANAYNGPMVKSGENPSRSFYGTTTSYANLLTTSNEEVFVITSCYLYASASMDIYASSTEILDGNLGLCGMQNNSLSNGSGRLIVPSGTTLRIRNTYSNQAYPYYIEGYFAYAP